MTRAVQTYLAWWRTHRPWQPPRLTLDDQLALAMHGLASLKAEYERLLLDSAPCQQELSATLALGEARIKYERREAALLGVQRELIAIVAQFAEQAVCPKLDGWFGTRDGRGAYVVPRWALVGLWCWYQLRTDSAEMPHGAPWDGPFNPVTMTYRGVPVLQQE